jgi:ADP-ribosylglycohydrolase
VHPRISPASVDEEYDRGVGGVMRITPLREGFRGSIRRLGAWRE